MALNEAEARKNSATALDKTTGATSEVAQREHPREEDHAPGRRQMLSAQVPAKSEKDSTASPSKGRAGTARCERRRTAALETAGERSVVPQLKKPLNEHGEPGRRQQPQVQEYDKSEESTTSKESTEVEDEHSPLASTSRPDLVPRDSQGPFPMKGHRRTKGDSDHQSSPEQTSSSDESSGDASSGAIEGASANPLNSHPNAFVRASYRLSAKIIRRRMKSAADKTEQLAGQAQSDAVDPSEGTSRGTLSEPTLAERHSDLLSDYPPDLRACIEDGMVATLDQMSTQALQLGTDCQHLIKKMRERRHLTDQQIKAHARFIHDLRMKMEREKVEEKREKERMPKEKKEKERMKKEKMEKEKMEKENEEKEKDEREK